jgi:hypothetical protein
MAIIMLKDRRVTIDGVELDPKPSQKLVNHSPDGFSWGYSGSGPAQLALALLLHFSTKDFALANYQQFKFDVVAGMTDRAYGSEIVTDWIKRKESEDGKQEL